MKMSWNEMIVARLAMIAIVMIAITPGVRAELPFTASAAQPVRTLDTGGFTTFEIHVTNLTDASVAVRATRLLVEIPDTSWHTSICSITTCYPEEVSVTPAEQVEAGGRTGFTLHVTAGRRYGDSARITLRLDTGPGTEFIDLPFAVLVREPVASIFRVEPERVSAAGSPDRPVTFDTYVHNETSDTLTLGVIRIEDYFPDETWESAICVEDTCYPVTTAEPPPIVVAPYHAALFRLTIVGHTPGQGHVVLRFNSTRGTDPLEKRFTVVMTPSRVGEDPERELDLGAPWPNPTAGALSIPLPTRGSRSSELIIFALDGTPLLDLSSQLRQALERRETVLRIDADRLPSGAYFYTITTEDGSRTDRFDIVR